MLNKSERAEETVLPLFVSSTSLDDDAKVTIWKMRIDGTDNQQVAKYQTTSDLEGLYSPSVAIRMEYNEVAHLTISGLLTFLMYMVAFLLIQLIASIVLAIIRKKKRAERNTAFTAVWHFANILLFTFCEVSMWYFIPAYPILKLIPMILVLLVLLVFAWKLFRKYKSPKTRRRFLIYGACLVVFGLLNGFFAGDCSLAKAIILTLIYIAFFAAALLLFRKQPALEEFCKGEKITSE